MPTGRIPIEDSCGRMKESCSEGKQEFHIAKCSQVTFDVCSAHLVQWNNSTRHFWSFSTEDSAFKPRKALQTERISIDNRELELFGDKFDAQVIRDHNFNLFLINFPSEMQFTS